MPSICIELARLVIENNFVNCLWIYLQKADFFFFLLLRLYNFRMFVTNFVLCSYIFITFNWMKYRLKFFFSLKIMIYSMNKYFSFYLKSFKDIFTTLAEINVNIFLIDISIFQQQLNITLVLSFTFFFFSYEYLKIGTNKGNFPTLMTVQCNIVQYCYSRFEESINVI